jgi:hypothetical protein
MTIKEKIKILKKARKKIETGEHWANGCYCTNKFDLPTDLFSLDAVNFCVMGAIYNQVGNTNALPFQSLNFAAKLLYEKDYITDVNDKIGLDAVLSCIDYNIDQLEAGIK